MINHSKFERNMRADHQNICISVILRIVYFAFIVSLLFICPILSIPAGNAAALFGVIVALATMYFTFWPFDRLIDKITTWNSNRREKNWG